MAELYNITIILNGVDITTLCPFEKLSHDDNLRSPSYFSLTVERPSFVPERGMQLLVIATAMVGTPTIFNGYVQEIIIRKRDNAIALEYDLDCGDIKAVLAATVIPYAEYAGTDAEIIAGLVANTYPDVSAYLDFSSGVDSFGDDLAFASNEESLLDALNRFADSTGANLRFDTRTGEGGIVLRFTPDVDIVEQGAWSTGGATPYWYAPFPTSDWDGELASSGGNPGYCAHLDMTSYTAPTIEYGGVIIHLGSALQVNNVSFDIKFHNGPAGLWYLRVRRGDSVSLIGGDLSGYERDVWHHIDCAALDPAAFPFTAVAGAGANGAANEFPINISGGFGSLSNQSILGMWIDNVIIETETAATIGNTDKLVYSPIPEAADFDLDIQNSVEFGSDFDLSLGAIDDFNSITVVGGKERVAIDEALESDGASVYMKLPFAVRSLAVYKNTGSDTTPSWTAQTLGIDGTDEITAKDVLHNPTEQFLYFASAPANMRKAVRITGFREKPIRVRVEAIGDGDMVSATTVTNENITSEEEAIAFGNALLAKKNAQRRLEFITYNEGLKVGQEMTVVDSVRGLSETLIIQRINTTWISGKTGKFSVECGEDEQSSIDNIIIGIDKKASQNAGNGAFATTTIEALLDEDGVQITDDLGSLLYESS
jgi:hypothetical protein